MNICSFCGGDLKVIKDKPYHYDECGLDVTLCGVTQYECADCEEAYVSLPNIQHLHRIIGAQICEKGKALLQPEEIRFLRKDLHMRAKQMARVLGTTPQALSRWENGHKPIGETHDRLFRAVYMMYASEQANHVICHGAIDMFSALPVKSKRKGIEKLKKIVLNPQEWLSDWGECCPV